ncbi:DUF4232 domain-containing protein [Streptomyces sp. VRA16 Mangrove soil]|uniref:DUF4232 domain-containing protein n=1 Tax=Streptomyces sp. VRA16 Mangrove soil TaxID=2817434 RepID=UPI001A9D397B|nr:DUF4232 domain-containing protein [Streptomyces sp. VRA16 Mangrove soil]MBO1332785.1 DUF4232 domain-containing protein [Streptomyces sp. VRA16 Mangrove soil]
MKSTRLTALAAISVVAALSLTACDNNDGSGGDASSQGSSSAPSASSSSSPAANGGSTSDSGSGSGGAQAGDAKPSSGGTNDAAGGATNAGAKVTFCKTQDLAIDAQDAAPDKETGRIDITMINRGSTTCSATGFPGVDIKDVDHTSNPIARGNAQPRITTLKPGDAAVFDLAYAIDSSGSSLASPTDILVTPPNETHTVSLAWPEGAGDIKGAYTDVEVYPTHTTK